jgi:dTDP-4-amino-4,6-dideoxygalactose transaminase
LAPKNVAGYCSRSGVFDPVTDLDVPFRFYRIDSSLHIDVEHLRAMLESMRPRVLLLIHYFGYPDPAYEEVVALARRAGALVIEDEAHAMLTDLVAARTGRLGDVCLLSLHKMLPVPSGGGLIINPGADSTLREIASEHPLDLGVYDLGWFARRRQENGELLKELLVPLRGRVDALHGDDDTVVPQTFPVLIRTVSRDKLYEAMNAAGFGVVSLYHTMIGALDRNEFSGSFELSRSIMNLPVHQDAGTDALRAMIELLDRLTHA